MTVPNDESEPTRPDKDVLGGPDPAGREDEIGGGPQPPGDETFGGPDVEGREDVMGRPPEDR